jgi:hypothetical protein
MVIIWLSYGYHMFISKVYLDVGQNGRPRGPQMEMSSLVLTIQLLRYLILTHTHLYTWWLRGVSDTAPVRSPSAPRKTPRPQSRRQKAAADAAMFLRPGPCWNSSMPGDVMKGCITWTWGKKICKFNMQIFKNLKSVHWEVKYGEIQS